MYLAVVNATKDQLNTQKLKAFRVTSGGPYDLRLNLTETEVYTGDYLDFTVTIENQGESSQDVQLEYWVSANGTAWYYSSEAIYTPEHSNQTISRSAYIFSNQPLGANYINAKVTYSSEKPSVTANATFTVKQRPYIPPTLIPPTIEVLVPPTEIPLGPLGIPNISIISYPKEISIVSGWTHIETVQVENIGQVDLTNITLLLIGLPSPWFEIKPKKYDSLYVGNISIFMIEFRAPKNAQPGKYDVSFFVFSNNTYDEKNTTITVFRSTDELLENEIKKLKEDVEKLEVDAKFAEELGKDVKNVLDLIREIKDQIALAETNLAKKLYEDAMANVDTAANLLERARNLLVKSTVTVKYKEEIVPFWQIWVIIIVLIVLNVVLVIVLWRKGVTKKMIKMLRPSLSEAKEIAGIVKEKAVDTQALAEERERITRMTALLDKEFKEGIISEDAYKELKKRNEDKLKDIEKKLK
jgi:hypothetical protein